MDQRKTFATSYIGIDDQVNNERKKYKNIFNRKCCAIYTTCIFGVILVCGFLLIDTNCDVFTDNIDICDLPSYCLIKDECHGSN